MSHTANVNVPYERANFNHICQEEEETQERDSTRRLEG